MKRMVMVLLVVGAIPFSMMAQEKGAASLRVQIGDQTKRSLNQPPKSFSRNSFKVEIDLEKGQVRGGGNRGGGRWDDNVDQKIARLERKIERLEDAIDYLLYMQETGGGGHREILYRCTMDICNESSAFFCDDHEFRASAAIGEDRVSLFEELKRRGVSYRSATFDCREM